MNVQMSIDSEMPHRDRNGTARLPIPNAAVIPQLNKTFWRIVLMFFFYMGMTGGLEAQSKPTARSSVTPQTRQTVLVLHSYHYGFSWTDNVSSGIQAAFASHRDRVELRFEFIDARHIYSRDYFEHYYRLLKLKYAQQVPDVVICSDDQSLNFMQAFGQELFPDVPIVFCSVSGYQPQAHKNQNITGLIDSIDIKATLDLALQLHPDTRTVAVITDTTRTGQALKAKARKVFNAYRKRVGFTYLEDFTVEELQHKIEALDRSSIIFLFIFNRDKAGRVFSHEQNLRNIARFAKVPIYSVWKFYLGYGILGGKLTSGEAEGRLVGRIALRILSGEAASDIPLGKSPTQYMFDYRQLNRFGLNERQLPANRVIVNQPFSFYQTYKQLIWIVSTAFMILLVCIVFLVVNISVRKKTDAALRKSEEKFSKFFLTSPIWMVLSTVKEGRYVEVNESFTKVTGYAREAVIGKTSIEFGLWPNPEDREDFVRRLEQAGRLEAYPVKFRMQNGAIRDFLLSTVVIEFNAEPYALSALVDITDRIQVENERKKLQEQLIQSQKLEALGTLAGGIAHDFNNILMGIQGRASLMRAEAEALPAIKENIAGIEEHVKSASQLTSQLLGFARGGKYEVLPTDLNDLVQKTTKMFGRTNKEIDIHFELQADLRPVNVDRNQIEQVLINLLINAGQAMPGGGKLYLKTEDVRIDTEYAHHHQVNAGRYVKLSVTDTGVGMDEATRQRIFEPFFTTKGMGRGIGLGLASVYGIIKNHNGAITVYSEKGQGTTFNIYLPPSTHTVRAVKKPEKRLPPPGNETVLLVDDEDFVIEIGQKLLEKMGYRVMVARNGDEALNLFRDYSDRVDLIILDMIMPGMSGSQTFDQLRKIDPDIKILLSSGYSINGQAADILARGCDGFIQKPFGMEHLSVKIREILDDRQY